MEFEWDKKKSHVNLVKHGIDFADAQFFFDKPVLSWIDTRKDYGETRFVGLGELHGEVVVLVYTLRQEKICRVISLRRARTNERRAYYSWLKDYEK